MVLFELIVRFVFKENWLFYYDMTILTCDFCHPTFCTKGLLHSHIIRVHREKYATRSANEREDNHCNNYRTLEKVEVQHTTFTSNSVCYNVYDFYNSLADTAEKILSSLHSLQQQLFA